MAIVGGRSTRSLAVMETTPKKRAERPGERLSKRMNQYPSESRIILTRNLAFGSSAACLVVLSQIIQVGAKDKALEIAVIAGCISMPLWIAIGTVVECFVFLGKQSYPFMASPAFRNALGGAFFVAGVALLTEIGASVWYLSETAAWALACSIAVSFIVVAIFWEVLARWWYRPGGPGTKE